MPEGLIDPALRNPLNFDRKEWFAAKRAGRDPRDIKAAFQRCWAASDSGKAFRSALEQRGYYLAKGDRRAVVAVDTDGNVYSVARWTGVKTKDAAARIGDSETLPTVAEVQEHVAALVRQKLTGFVGAATEAFAQAAQALEGRRIAMVESHRTVRRVLLAEQEQRCIAEAKARQQRFRKGLRGLWDRVTGRHAKLREENEREATAAAERDAAERQSLVERRFRARLQLQQDIRTARQSHTRELTWLRRFFDERLRNDHSAAEQESWPKLHRRRRGPTFSSS